MKDINQIALQLIQELYNGLSQNRGLDDFMATYKKLENSTHAMFFEIDLSAYTSTLKSPHMCIDPEFVELFNTYYGDVNPFIFENERDLFKPGHVALSHELIEPAVMQKTEFYADFFKRFDLYYGIGGTIGQLGDKIYAVNMCRSKHHGPYSEEDKALFKLLSPHLQQAFFLLRKMEMASFSKGHVEAAFHWLDIGLIVVNSENRMVFTNQYAQELLRKDAFFKVRFKTLELADSTQSQQLKTIVQNTIQCTQGQGLAPGGSIMISTPENCHYSLLVCPLPKIQPGLLFEEHCAAIFISGEKESFYHLSKSLTGWRGLSVTEAQVAVLLVLGHAPKDIQDQMNISIHTVRAHIRNIYAKVEVHRISELISLIMKELPHFLLVRPHCE